MYYFGCGNGAGHYLWNQNWSSTRGLPADFPLARFETLDAGLLPHGEQHGMADKQVEGRLRVWRTDGWVILTWWDRTVDTRFACNSSFVMRSEPDETVPALLRRGLEAFPKVAQPIKFQFSYNGEVIAH